MYVVEREPSDDAFRMMSSDEQHRSEGTIADRHIQMLNRSHMDIKIFSQYDANKIIRKLFEHELGGLGCCGRFASKMMRRNSSKSKGIVIKKGERITRIDDPFLKVRNGQLDELRNRLESGDLNAHSTRWSGFTMLHRAAEIGHNDLCQLFIEVGKVPVNTRSVRGWYSPLHIALANGHMETAYFLISMGANPWMKSKYGEDPFDYGGKRGFGVICEELKKKVQREDMKRSLQRMVTMSEQKVIAQIQGSHQSGDEEEEEGEREEEQLDDLNEELEEHREGEHDERYEDEDEEDTHTQEGMSMRPFGNR